MRTATLTTFLLITFALGLSFGMQPTEPPAPAEEEKPETEEIDLLSEEVDLLGDEIDLLAEDPPPELEIDLLSEEPPEDAVKIDLFEEPPAEETIDLLQEDMAPEPKMAAPDRPGIQDNEADVHAQLPWQDEYPSAKTCKTCHPVHYREWSVSPHAYAQMSPVFNAFQGAIFKLTNGTNGDFCIRCHTPVGMNRGEEIFISNIDRHPTSREGITCIVCHRVNREYGKISGRLALPKGNLLYPVQGPTGGEEVERIIGERIVDTNPDTASGRKIHSGANKFFQLTEPGFCGSCHDVNLLNGFRLEEAFSQYKTSPAAKLGISCQDCHMGVIPGAITEYANGEVVDATNYPRGSAAFIGGPPGDPNTIQTRERRLTNHMFAGPDHSVIHPGIFPHNADAVRDELESEGGLATIREWVQFDWKADWGTNDFERAEQARSRAGDGTRFPERWTTRASRRSARRIIDDQLTLLDEYDAARVQVLRNGLELGDVVIEKATRRSLQFKVEVKNVTNGHPVPTGFIGERLFYLRVDVVDAEGSVIFRSGDLDPNGDLRDLHSLYVHNHELPQDKYLFSLQSKFLTRNIRGGEREQVLAINHSLGPLPFLRPSTFATTLTGQPFGARIHRQLISPEKNRWATYKIKKKQLTGKAPYEARIQLIAGMIPVNLVDAIKFVGFDYGMTAGEVAREVVDGHRVLWERKVRIDVP